MAVGDAASAAGLSTVAPTDDRRIGYEDINRRGDELADHITDGTHDWSKITDKPSTSTLDGRDIFVSNSAPTSGDGSNGDIWLEY